MSFVCPSDRQLALRGRLRTGWSQPRAALSPEEQQAIVSVIERNEALERAERQRVGRLVDMLNQIKERMVDSSSANHCRLCGQIFRFLRSPRIICEDCQKPVCSKCAVELNGSGGGGGVQVLCQVCSLTREIWKKSGAWFYKGFPQYDLPERSSMLNSSAKRGSSFIIRKAAANIRLNDDDCSSSSGSNHGLCESTSRDSFDDTDLGASGGGGAVSAVPSTGDRKMLPCYDYTAEASAGGAKQYDSASVCSAPIIMRHRSRDSIRETPIGWLEVDLSYNIPDQVLYCTVLRARDLPAMDTLGLTDPFCKLNVVSFDGACRQSNWSRTKTVHKTRNPEFNESITFAGIMTDAILQSALYITLLDDDKYGHDFLGAAIISLAPLLERNIRMSAPLVKEDAIAGLAVLEGPWPRGQILLAITYNTKKRALQVLIKECKNLISMDSNGLSDPFVKIQLKPDGHRKKFRTNIRWRNLNPVFNEEFFFETRPNDLDKQSLIITVWDKDLGKSNDFLGSLVLSGSSKGSRLKQWRDCVRLPDHYHEQWHSLSNEQNPK